MIDPVIEEIQALRRDRHAVVLAHTYQPGPVQDIADFVGDSYGLSVEAARTDAQVIVFCGVLFMAETAAILNPEKEVLLPVDAGCPMADMITADDLRALKQEHPGAQVVCYVNSSAEVKALSDVCVTSSNAVKIVERLPKDRPILFVPDTYLGSFIAQKTGRDMVLWNGFCPTHARITPAMVTAARHAHPGALVMMHPEAPDRSRALADEILSTGQMCSFVQKDAREEYLVATEIGLIHTLEKRNPGKKFYPVADVVTCPNMRKGSLEAVAAALKGTGGQRISVSQPVAQEAERALRLMLEMSR